MIRSPKSFDLSNSLSIETIKTSSLSTSSLSSLTPIAQTASKLRQQSLQSSTPELPDYPIDLSSLIPLAPPTTIYHRHQSTIQAFLQQTQTELSDYFDAINDPKKINFIEVHPSFIAMPMDYQQIQATAHRAFTNAIYVKEQPRDGCYARAELAAIDLDPKDQGTSGKIVVTGDDLCLTHPIYQHVAWGYHVAAAAVSKEGTLFVIDPCVSKEPIKLNEWLEKFAVGNTIDITFTDARYYYNTEKTFTPITDNIFKRVPQAKDTLSFLAKRGYAPNENQLNFGHFLQLTDSQ